MRESPRRSPVQAVLSAAGRSVGVQEEFLLLDESGTPVGAGPSVLLTAGRTTAAGPGAALHHELLTAQVEADTGPCVTLGAVAQQVRSARDTLARAAAATGARLASAGVPPLGGPRVPVMSGERYAVVADRHPWTRDHLGCGTHVHVGVPGREAAVAVVNHVARWVPTLLALGANSPFHEGADTGHASWRVVERSRLPGSGLPPHFTDADAHDRAVSTLVDSGALPDPRRTFWLLRPSTHQPTVEFRAADAQTDPADTVLLAALCRALVRHALTELSAGREATPVNPELGAAAVWSAARYGLIGPGVDLARGGRRIPSSRLVRDLVRLLTPALSETGDLNFVRERTGALLRAGGPATRQRKAAADGPTALLTHLTWPHSRPEPERRAAVRT